MGPYRILFMEDNREDFLLLQRALRNESVDFHCHRESSLEGLKNALCGNWDLLITDYHLGPICATDVLELVRIHKSDLPVIVVSGALREENAVNLLRSGARDFVRKDHLARLVPAIIREIHESAERKSKLVIQNKLRASQERNEVLLQALPQLVWTSLPDGQCTFLSRQWLEYTSQALSYQHDPGWMKNVIHPDDIERLNEHWLGATEGIHEYNIECRIRRHDGVYRWFKNRAVPQISKDGQTEYWLGTCTDVNAERLASEELRISKDQAERANETKSAFLANMSHELRTPLGAIIGFCEILREGQLTPLERDTYLTSVIRNSKGLTRIIDDILDLAKVEAGKLEVEQIEFDLFELIQDSINLFLDTAAEKNISLEFEIDPRVPQKLKTDPTRLRQILINIIGNAVKFTTEGGIYLSILALPMVDEQLPIEIRVRDTGIGLKPDQAEKLFRPFTQAENSTNRKYGGTGLGLVLSRRLAQALGGDISIAASNPSNAPGCTFVITFKTCLVAHPASAALITASTDQSTTEQSAPVIAAPLRLQGKQILLAEDSKDNQFLVVRLLKKNGAIVEIANNGEEAIEKAKTGNYDLVLMDIQMPKVDGYEATRTLRSIGFKTPIVALTAHAMLEERMKTKEAGCDGHLTKPLNAAELVQTIADLS